jgi:hypothetical protein
MIPKIIEVAFKCGFTFCIPVNRKQSVIPRQCHQMPSSTRAQVSRVLKYELQAPLFARLALSTR